MDKLLLSVNIHRILEDAEDRIIAELKTELDTFSDVYNTDMEQKYKAEIYMRDVKIQDMANTVNDVNKKNELLKIEVENMKLYMGKYVETIGEASQKISTYEAMIRQMNQNYNTLVTMYNNSKMTYSPDNTNQYSNVYYPPEIQQQHQQQQQQYQDQYQQMQMQMQQQVDERRPSFIQASYSPIQPQKSNEEAMKSFREAFLNKMRELGHCKA